MKGVFFCWVFVAVFVQTVFTADEDLVVKTTYGAVKGYHVKSYEERTVTAFEGIPYAKPPVGKLRFKEPQRPEPWNDTLVANKKYTCLQYITLQLNGGITGEEDCLYLYIYVPREKVTSGEKLDVVIHIHAGGFTFGDPQSWASYEYIMDRDLIYVTFNYRLGILGFLSTQDEIVPGNNGLKDQVLAMKWIKQNIERFGGNPQSITLTGASTGGSSVHLHYLSPLSTGLFHRGISHSGTALNVYSLVKNPLENSRKLGALFNCSTASSKHMIDCLSSKPVKDIVAAERKFFTFINLVPGVPFGPVIEYGNAFAFLPDHPYRLMLERKINDCPWVVSNTKDEGIAPVGFLYLYDKVDELDLHWDELAPVMLEYNFTADEVDKTPIARAVRRHYFGDEPISINNGKNLLDVFSDRWFLVDTIKAITAHAKAAVFPVYYYRFEYYLKNKAVYNTNLTAVAHVEDTRLLYRQADSASVLPDTDRRMKDIFLDFLYNYAHTGVPTFNGNTWYPLYSTSEPTSYLRIFSPDTIRREGALDLEAFNFWKQLPLWENENLLGYLPKVEQALQLYLYNVF